MTPPRPNLAFRLMGGLTPEARERLRRLAPSGLSREALCRAYLDEGRSVTAIAQQAGCTPRTVLFNLALHGIPIRGGGGGDRENGPRDEEEV